jgi:ubiquinone/menaquinone biosynthesis C-methylase UbiE
VDIEEYSKYSHIYSDQIPSSILDLVQNKEWNTMLDLGCGDGSHLYALNKRGLTEGKIVYAVDLSENRVNRAKSIDQNYRCYVDDACNLKNIPSESIDLLISYQVIEHVDDDEIMVQEIRRVLRKGGTAFISTVFKKRWAWYFYRCNQKWTLDPTHVREYVNEADLLDLVRKHGMVVEKQSKETFQLSPAVFLLRKLNVSEKSSPTAVKLLDIKVPVMGYYIWDIICKKS